MTNKGTFKEKTNLNTPRILILRFSSLGDVVQCLSVPAKLKQRWPTAEIHWVTREEFAPLLKSHPALHRVWTISKKAPLWGQTNSLWSLSKELNDIEWTHVYDAHRSLRSTLLCFFLRLRSFKEGVFLNPFDLLRKSQKRWKRFLLFRLGLNTYRQPFSGQRDLLEPLQKWGINEELPPPPQLFFPQGTHEEKGFDFSQLPSRFIALAPSAAHALKRWPLHHWESLIEKSPSEKFVILGGKEDFFLSALEKFPNVMNLAGKTNLIESAKVVERSQVLICNDTGPMHFGEQLGHPTIALMGPAPFGFPSRPTTKVLERHLKCRPCSKHGQGPCTNKVYQACLVNIEPAEVLTHMKDVLKLSSRAVPPEAQK